MSKRVSASPEERARRINRVVKAGFDYVQFSEHHFRFEGYVDFWPSSDKWRVGSSGETGHSTDTLIAKLKQRFPELAETAA